MSKTSLQKERKRGTKTTKRGFVSSIALETGASGRAERETGGLRPAFFVRSGRCRGCRLFLCASATSKTCLQGFSDGLWLRRAVGWYTFMSLSFRRSTDRFFCGGRRGRGACPGARPTDCQILARCGADVHAWSSRSPRPGRYGSGCHPGWCRHGRSRRAGSPSGSGGRPPSAVRARDPVPGRSPPRYVRVP